MRYVFVLVALMSPSVAAADTPCRFTKVCQDAGPCRSTDFRLTYGSYGPDRGITQIVADIGKFEVALFVLDDTAMMLAGTETAAHVMSVNQQTGAARYTRHLAAGPRAKTYIGQCGERQR